MELYELGIKQAQDGLAKGDFSSVELVQSVIDRYHAKNGEIGAYLSFDEEGALALAKEADEARLKHSNTQTLKHSLASSRPRPLLRQLLRLSPVGEVDDERAGSVLVAQEGEV